LTGAPVGVDRGDVGFGLLDGRAGVGGASFAAASMPEPGLAGVVICVPHRRAQVGLQLTFQVSDGPGVRLPCLTSGVDGRLQRVELFEGFGPALLSLVRTVDEGLPSIVELLSPWFDPVRHSGFRLRLRRGPFRVEEAPELGDCGTIGSIVGEDAVEQVTCFAEVLVLGDDVDPVLVPPASGCDVQPAMRRSWRGEGDANVDGVALMAVLGGGVPQPNTLRDVVGRERHHAAAGAGDGERSIGVGGGDRPQVAVADDLTVAGDEPAVVPAGHDDLTDMGPFITANRNGAVRAEPAGVEAGVLDGVVECVDVLVAAGRHCHRLSCAGQREPVAGDSLEVLVEAAGLDASVVHVGVECGGLAGAQLERSFGFPGVGEAVDADQLVHAADGAQLGEHPAPPDSLQLPGVTDQYQAPVEMPGEVDELVQGPGPDHAGLIDHDRGGRREPVAVIRQPIAALPLVEELGSVSVSIPVSARTWAALAVGATPNTIRPFRPRSWVAAASMVVLPVPAGPTTTTTRSRPATAAAASACRTSSPSRSTVGDGTGWSIWAPMAQVRIRSSSVRTAGEVQCGLVGCCYSDRPSDSRRRLWLSGSRSTH
jgi:hypothetical protein